MGAPACRLSGMLNDWSAYANQVTSCRLLAVRTFARSSRCRARSHMLARSLLRYREPQWRSRSGVVGAMVRVDEVLPKPDRAQIEPLVWTSSAPPKAHVSRCPGAPVPLDAGTVCDRRKRGCSLSRRLLPRGRDHSPHELCMGPWPRASKPYPRITLIG